LSLNAYFIKGRTMTIRILIADDQQLFRDGLRALIERENDMDVVAEAENGREAIELAKDAKPDLIVMDINMPDLNGIDATQVICKELPDIKLIALSIHSTQKFVSEMIRAGASGYIVKHCAFKELAMAIRTVSEGKPYLCTEILSTVMDEFASNSPSGQLTVFSALSTREREVMQLVAEGMKSEEIASHLFISVKTVSSHRRHIMKKLNLKSQTDITRYAISEGLISSEY
jgi:DNA-binding NarL/FixJ family response regulator